MPITQEEHSRPSKRRMMNKDDVFDFLSLGTTTLAAADGPTFGLRTTAVLANQIIAIIQEMRANKAEARELVDRLKEYISAITEFEPKKSSRTFASLIASMNQSLNEVLHIVAKVKARSGFVRLVYVKKDRRSLEKAKSRLQYAFSHFDLMSSISAAYDAKEIREDVSDISGHLVAAGADASTNIVKIGNYINAMSFTVQNMSLDVKKIAFLVMVLALWTTQSQIPQDTSHGNRKIRVRAHQNARNLDRMGSIKVPLISSLWFKPMNRGMTEGQKTLTAQECRIINITQGMDYVFTARVLYAVPFAYVSWLPGNSYAVTTMDRTMGASRSLH
ncbi:hypothetical protein NM688_g3377 [Phlebia brevispora]|uniref:Uncharacterized protein n=1 Tax=Phlebia brevispora TaxID=194682 RepID=A0ACC1T5V9_9APHY|nr:hypothetical protein NM688_g3377 [Phlebia brevispora]